MLSLNCLLIALMQSQWASRANDKIFLSREGELAPYAR